MLEILDRKTRLRTALLPNAFGVKEELRRNGVSSLVFSLPGDDPKNALCTPFTLVRGGMGLYRILPKSVRGADTNQCTYTCEHVIASLMDTMLFGYHVIGGAGYDTAQAIRYVLAHQHRQDWRLGRCDFSAQFEYGLEQETLLGALFSLAQPFTAPYRWRYETDVYPWTLHLERLDTDGPPALLLMDGNNILSVSGAEDPTDLCTRLYPLGYGEGINQLTIREVNGGVPYLESPPELLEKYGVIERVWVDRSYENAGTLKAAAQAMLEELQRPGERYRVPFAHLPEGKAEALLPGDRVRVLDRTLGLDLTAFVSKIVRYWDDPERSEVILDTRPRDPVKAIADLSNRQRIEQTYSQGATNLYAQSLQTNADTEHGAQIHFYIPEEMRIVNKVIAKIRASRFRGYTKGIAGGGKTKATSAAGGADVLTSESGGEGTQTSRSGGGGAVTSSASSMTSTGTSLGSQSYGETNWPVPRNVSSYSEHTHEFVVPSANHVHSMNHTHSVALPSHSHTVELPEHTHKVKLKNHTHTLELPDHTHKVEPGIYLFNGCTGFSVAVNGEIKIHFDSLSAEVDLTEYLIEDGVIPRGKWHTVSVIPDNLGYISIDMFVQGFVQSRGDWRV